MSEFATYCIGGGPLVPRLALNESGGLGYELGPERRRVATTKNTGGGSDVGERNFRQELEDWGVPAESVQGLVGESVAAYVQAAAGLQGLAKRHGRAFEQLAPQVSELITKPEWAPLAAQDPVGTIEKAYLALRAQRPVFGGADDAGAIRERYDMPRPLTQKDERRNTVERYAKQRLDQVLSDEFFR